jgi:hypothetical protein
MNEREVKQSGSILYRVCVVTLYYHFPVSIPLFERANV